MGKQGFASMDREKVRELGRRGGRKTHRDGSKPKGFAAMSRERARELGRIGGAKSKRGKAKKNEGRQEKQAVEAHPQAVDK